MNKKSDSRVFIDKLSEEALASSAVNHPYLSAFAKGSLPNLNEAYRDFAFQYGEYSKHFVQYLKAVIDKLEKQSHRDILKENLEEEVGNCHGADLPDHILEQVNDEPHSLLFKRFQEAAGVTKSYRLSNTPTVISQNWSKQFLSLCQADEQTGIGAIGMGTESIVSSIYAQILEGLNNHSSISLHDRVFFDLHSQCDDAHAEQIKNIAIELSENYENRKKLCLGVSAAIKLRTQFWDHMLERANCMKKTELALHKESCPLV